MIDLVELVMHSLRRDRSQDGSQARSTEICIESRQSRCRAIVSRPVSSRSGFLHEQTRVLDALAGLTA